MDSNAEENKPMDIVSEENQSTAARKRKAEDSYPVNSSDEMGGDIGDDDGEESDASSREEGQDWDVDSFDDGIDYRPKKNLDPNDEIGQKMHRYRSQMYRSKVFRIFILGFFENYITTLLIRLK